MADLIMNQKAETLKFSSAKTSESKFWDDAAGQLTRNAWLGNRRRARSDAPYQRVCHLHNPSKFGNDETTTRKDRTNGNLISPF
jgi:hypothetical protein